MPALIRLFSFWMLFFAAFRLAFILWLHREWSPDMPASIWASFWHALPLDFSTAAYLMVIPVLLWYLGALWNSRRHPVFSAVIVWFNKFAVAITLVVFATNIFVFEEWHTLINQRAMMYLRTPNILLFSLSWFFITGFIVLYIAFLWLLIRIIKIWVGNNYYTAPVRKAHFLLFPIIIGLLVVAVRGTGVMGINESAVYYSSHPFNNQAATNPGWYLVHSLLEVGTTTNRYQVDHPATFSPLLMRTFPDTNASKVMDLMPGQHPNVVFIIMESMTAQVIEELGGERGVCPNLSQIIKDGISMSHCYGSGYRTDQGLVATLAGYPAQPDRSIILDIEKAGGLSSVPKTLKERAAYSSAFIHGSELTFANFKVWLSGQKMDPIISKDDFTTAEQRQHWGADDSIILQRAVREMGQLKPPFCASALTVSLHPPFDAPYRKRWPSNSLHDQFLNSAAFADEAIGAFFKTAAAQPWFSNTLFVLVADHGSPYPNSIGMDQPMSRQIPLILYSPLLKKTSIGLKIPVYCQQSDIPATVLSMIGRADLIRDLFPWSRNIFGMNAFFEQYPADKKHNFAYYTDENGIGWATPEGKAFYHFGNKSWALFEGKVEAAEARAYLHLLYDDFLNR